MKCELLLDVNHRWNTYLGQPNCTSLWQVGDSSKQTMGLPTDMNIKYKATSSSGMLVHHGLHCMFLYLCGCPEWGSRVSN